MRTKLKKLTSVCLAVIMILSVLTVAPFTAGAAENNSESVSGSTYISGDFEYEVLDDGTAGITGYNGSATELEIPSTLSGYAVTSICCTAFKGCTSLTSLTIPGSVTKIGGGAFECCTSLASITIPNSVKSLDGFVFNRCTSLTNITIPNSVTSIGTQAFTACSSLTSVIIPDSVTTIGWFAFSDCTNLKNIEIPDSIIEIGYHAFYNTEWYSNQPDGLVYINNVAYDYKGEMPKNTSITLRDGTKSIADHAFWDCTGLINITFPSSVTYIGTGVFEGCTSLKSVNILYSVTYIGEKAFGYIDEEHNWNYKKIDGFTIYGYTSSAAETYANENGFTFISLGDVKTDFEYEVLDDGTAKITKYSGEDSTIKIPNEIDGYAVSAIGNSVFANCDFIKNVVIPESIILIEKNAFSGCGNIKRIFYEGNVDAWYNIEDGGGNDNLIYGVEIYFNGTVNPDWFGEIEWNIDELGTLYIGGNGVINPNEHSLNEDILWYSDRKSIKNIVIEDGIIGIGNYAFMECSNLETVSIPESVTYIGDFVFMLDMNSLQSVNVDENNANYTSVDGVLFNKDMSEIIKCPNGRSGKYTLPETVTTIHTCAFRECKEVTELEIPESVTTIERYAFYDCDSLLSVTIPNSVTEIALGCGLGYKFHKSFDEPINGFTIKGHKNTTAETYANKNGFTFIALDNLQAGDVDGDGKVSIDDVTDIQKHLANMVDFTKEQVSLADVDKNGTVSIDDVTLIQKHLAGLAVIE